MLCWDTPKRPTSSSVVSTHLPTRQEVYKAAASLVSDSDSETPFESSEMEEITQHSQLEILTWSEELRVNVQHRVTKIYSPTESQYLRIELRQAKKLQIRIAPRATGTGFMPFVSLNYSVLFFMTMWTPLLWEVHVAINTSQKKLPRFQITSSFVLALLPLTMLTFPSYLLMLSMGSKLQERTENGHVYRLLSAQDFDCKDLRWLVALSSDFVLVYGHFE